MADRLRDSGWYRCASCAEVMNADDVPVGKAGSRLCEQCPERTGEKEETKCSKQAM